MTLTPVWQTEHGPGGNCYAACLATILGVPLADVPDLRGDPVWGPKLNAWLIPQGWLATFHKAFGREVRRTKAPPGLAILSHRLFTGQVHAAVFVDGRFFHDPADRPLYRQDTLALLWTIFERTKPCE